MATLMQVDVLLELSARALATIPSIQGIKDPELAKITDKEEDELLAYRDSLYSSSIENIDMQEGVNYLKSIIEKYTS